MTSVVMGASRPEQVEQNVGALAKLDFTAEELARIDALTRLSRAGRSCSSRASVGPVRAAAPPPRACCARSGRCPRISSVTSRASS